MIAFASKHGVYRRTSRRKISHHIKIPPIKITKKIPSKNVPPIKIPHRKISHKKYPTKKILHWEKSHTGIPTNKNSTSKSIPPIKIPSTNIPYKKIPHEKKQLLVFFDVGYFLMGYFPVDPGTSITSKHFSAACRSTDCCFFSPLLLEAGEVCGEARRPSTRS